MQLEVGEVLSGKVTGITKYGVFVDLGPETTGMVHISEVASTYVREITDHVSVGQQVSVKVLSIDERGRISLSMKQASEPSADGGASGRQGGRPQQGGRPAQGGRSFQGGQSSASKPSEGGSFDDMLKSFMQSSDEKMSELRRSGAVDHRPRRRK